MTREGAAVRGEGKGTIEMLAGADIGRVSVRRDLPVPMRDGVLLRADVYRPVGRGPFPVLLCRTPYDKTHPRYVRIALALARAGYLAVVEDIRGRDASDGTWVWHLTPEGHEVESRDGYDTCEWAAALPSADGQVGTWGNSYPSFAIWVMAATQPPSLRAIFTSGFPVSHRVATQGIFETGIRLRWQHRMAVSSRRRVGDLAYPRTVDEASRNWDDVERQKWLWHVPMTELPDRLFGPTAAMQRRYWEEINGEHWGLERVHPRISAPTLTLTGWWDRLSSSADHYRGMVGSGPAGSRGEHRLVIGPWVHDVEGEPNWRDPRGRGTGPDDGHLAHLLRWYDHHLRARDVGLDDEPPVKVYVLNEGWRFLGDWPPPARERAIYLRSTAHASADGPDGSLSHEPPGREPPDRYVYDPADPVMSPYDGQLTASDRSVLAPRPDVLVYRSAPLDEDVVVVGEVRAHIWFASDQPETDVVVRLIEEPPEGPAVDISQGIRRTRYRHGFDRVSRLEPDEPTEVIVMLRPVGIRFRQGTSIRVDITSSDFPAYDRNHNTGRPFHADGELRVARQTVLHDTDHPSRIVLPIVAGSSSSVE